MLLPRGARRGLAVGRFAFMFGWRLAIFLVLTASTVIGPVSSATVAAERCMWTCVTSSAFSTALFASLPMLPGVVVPSADEAALGGLTPGRCMSEGATVLANDKGRGGLEFRQLACFPKKFEGSTAGDLRFDCSRHIDDSNGHV